MPKNKNQYESRESATTAIHRILQQFKIDIEHPADCLAEAEHCLQHTGHDDPALAQWQHLPFVTIDNPDSRDLDQALLIENAEDSGYRVRYALADAAYYVPPGSALFREAMRRGVTYYTPLLAAPMLPTVLSEGLVSLNPNVLRRALVFDITLSSNGAVRTTTVVRALVQSQAKLSYAGVQAFFDGEEPHVFADKAWAPSLLLLRELGELLIQQALDRDVIPFNRTEADIKIVDDGIHLARRTRVRTEKYNEQISLLCNMQGAELLSRLRDDNPELQAIFRVHGAPLASRLKSLRSLITSFVDQAGLDSTWLWHKDQSLADYIESLPTTPETRSKVLAIERQVLVSNQASRYRQEPGRHHALAATSYARFSSPMREIVGVFTHKELLEALGVNPSQLTIGNNGSADDEALHQSIIEIANQSRQTQKQINKAVEFIALSSTLNADLKKPEPPMRQGIVMGFRKNKIYVACESIAVDLKITQSDIEAQYNTEYKIGELSADPASSSCPQWVLGDEVLMATDSFDIGNNRYRLRMFKTSANK